MGEGGLPFPSWATKSACMFCVVEGRDLNTTTIIPHAPDQLLEYGPAKTSPSHSKNSVRSPAQTRKCRLSVSSETAQPAGDVAAFGRNGASNSTQSERVLQPYDATECMRCRQQNAGIGMPTSLRSIPDTFSGSPAKAVSVPVIDTNTREKALPTRRSTAFTRISSNKSTTLTAVTARKSSSASSSSPDAPGGLAAHTQEIRYAAVRAAWECKFDTATELINSACGDSCAVIWAAKAEINLLRASLTGRRSDFALVFDYCNKVCETNTWSLADRTVLAEVTLWRGIVQAILGQPFRSCWNMRAAFVQLKKLSKDKRIASCPSLQSRIRANLGYCYLGVPLMPATYRPWFRLFGFPTDEKQCGYDMIKEEALNEDSECNIPCALIMSLYHLDVEPNLDMVRDLIVANLTHTPNCPLLHWVASICAWRYAEIDDARFLLQEAISCCVELKAEPLYLKYELLMLYFVETQYEAAIESLMEIHTQAENVVFPFRAMLPVLLSASHWALGRIEVGDEFALEAVKLARTRSTLEINLVKVLETARKRSSAGKALFAIEICYLLRLLTRVPLRIMQAYFDTLHLCNKWEERDEGIYVPMLQCILSFHLGDVTFVRDVCMLLENLALKCDDKYYKAHGLYWCSRIWYLVGDKARAASCALNSKKIGKRYPFNINLKVSAFLDSIEKGEKV
eukprot:GEMP01034961.1.p1 GENE.GEMP01034961.1~~GEMP01034961.1.p1  ORF type:complete len:682 (+),score=115.60 GEMP01034961.1:21-2066(+)